MKKRYLAIAIITLLMTSCLKEEFEEQKKDLETNVTEKNMEELKIPDDFTFSTATTISLVIKDDSEYTRYDLYDEDNKTDIIGSGFVNEGQLKLSLTVPTNLTNFYAIRTTVKGTTNHTIPVTFPTTSYTMNSTNQRVASDCYEKLYAVNNDGGFYTINNESGSYDEEQLSNLEGGGSIACAVDKENKKVYYNTGTTLRYYDLNTNTFNIAQQGNPFNGNYPRMEYNNVTKELYISNNTLLYIIDPLTNIVKENYTINGLESPTGGGDLAISLDGTVYLCCFSGLYRLDFSGGGSVIQATRISADNLPFQPTSMAIDRNDRLYLATNDANSQLILMDKFDGSYQIARTYNHKINDLGSLPCSVEELSTADNDSDNIINQLDDYPNDPDRAADLFTPSEFGWGTLGFEDLWPYKGDFDFNDLAIHYRFKSVLNANNEVVEILGYFKVNSLNASYQSGFGLALPFDESIIQEVTGSELTEGLITLNEKGLETGQTTPVVIVFDNAFKQGNYGECVAPKDKEIVITIKFVSPQDLSIVGTPPFNAFIFVNTRGNEVHLADNKPTDKADVNVLGTGHDTSNGVSRYYKTDTNLPWAINIIHNFKVPRSGIAVNQGYNKFNEWAESGGISYTDWYKDNSGYRNISNLCDQ